MFPFKHGAQAKAGRGGWHRFGTWRWHPGSHLHEPDLHEWPNTSNEIIGACRLRCCTRGRNVPRKCSSSVVEAIVVIIHGSSRRCAAGACGRNGCGARGICCGICGSSTEVCCGSGSSAASFSACAKSEGWCWRGFEGGTSGCCSYRRRCRRRGAHCLVSRP